MGINNSEKTMKELVVETFNKAINENYSIVGVALSKDDGLEYVITRTSNLEKKLKYYVDNYIENGYNKFNSGEKIVDIDYADYVDELKWFREVGSVSND
jgi:hypothetical protein